MILIGFGGGFGPTDQPPSTRAAPTMPQFVGPLPTRVALLGAVCTYGNTCGAASRPEGRQNASSWGLLSGRILIGFAEGSGVTKAHKDAKTVKKLELVLTTGSPALVHSRGPIPVDSSS
jgi:hypothetical protein